MQVVISMRIVACGRGASDYMLYSFLRPAVGIVLIQGYIYIYTKKAVAMEYRPLAEEL